MASVTKTITESVGEIQKTTSLYFGSFEDFMEYERVVNGVSATRDVSVTTTKAQLTALEVGKTYRVIKEVRGTELALGNYLVVVGGVDQDGEYRAELPDGSDFWYIKPDEVEEI